MFRYTSHFFHFFMTVITWGLWLPIWIWRVYANRKFNEQLLATLGSRQKVTVTVNNGIPPVHVPPNQEGRANHAFVSVLFLLLLAYCALMTTAMLLTYNQGKTKCRMQYPGAVVHFSVLGGCKVTRTAG